jgi:hypothetical protein
MVRPYSKIPEAKRTGGIAHVIVCLSSKCRVLSSNPSTAKKKRKERKGERKRKKEKKDQEV